MRRVAIAVVAAGVGYAIGAAGGFALVSLASSNTHDRSVEAATTAAFVAGPPAAVIACAVAILRSRGSRAPADGR